MCGILCEICYGHSSLIKYDEKVLRRMKNRGPDLSHDVELYAGGNKKVYFFGSVLWMQGDTITRQPVEDRAGILLFSGDIFDETWYSGVSDTQIIMLKLIDKVEYNKNWEDHIIKVLRALKGPFGLIYYDKQSRMLFFSRDRLGRSTLLFYKDDKNRIVIGNVLGRDYENCIEVSADNIFAYHMESRCIYVYNWSGLLGADIYDVDDWYSKQKLVQNKPDDQFSFKFDESEKLIDNDNIINYIETAAKENPDKLKFMSLLLEDERIKDVVLNVTKLLEESVSIRVKRQPQKCKECMTNSSTSACNDSPIGILFSGGLDCTILALLVDKFLPENQSIDLINVAFKKDDKNSYDVPDRLTGKQSYKELKKLCPNRVWAFIEVNVPKNELEEFQASHIADLVYPRKTILDESLGSALWFAARAKSCGNTQSFCRVLFLGSGADELFGGYSRHRNAYKRNGWSGLAKELMLDWKRISVRNLSRDNRVITDHGRQPRMPYLDETFSSYVLKLKPWFICFPSELLGPGVGDKLLLRLVALNLGLSDVVLFPKRALQFGSRIANKKEKGSDISKSFEKVTLIDH